MTLKFSKIPLKFLLKSKNMSRWPKVSLHIYQAYNRPPVPAQCRISQQRVSSTAPTKCLGCSAARWLSYDKKLIAQYFPNLPRTCSKSTNNDSYYSSQHRKVELVQGQRVGVKTEADEAEDDDEDPTDFEKETDSVIQSDTMKLADSSHEVQIDFKILFQPDKQENVVSDTAKLIEAISSIFNVELSLEDKAVASNLDMPKIDETYGKSLIGQISEYETETSSEDEPFTPEYQEMCASSENDKVTQPESKAKLRLEDAALSSVTSNAKNLKGKIVEYETEEDSTENEEYIPVILGEQKSEVYSEFDKETQSDFNTKLSSEDSTESSDISISDETETDVNYNNNSDYETEKISTEYKPVLRGEQNFKVFSESDKETESNFNAKLYSEGSTVTSELSNSDEANINSNFISDYETEESSTENKPVIRGEQKSNNFPESDRVKPVFNAKLSSKNPTVSSDMSKSYDTNIKNLKSNISKSEMEDSSLENTENKPVNLGKQISNVSQPDKAKQLNFGGKLSEDSTISSDISNSGLTNKSKSISNSSEYKAEESSTEIMPVIQGEQKSKTFTECDKLTKSNVVKEPFELTKCIVSFSNKNEVVLNLDIASPFSDTQKLILIHHAVLKALSILEAHKSRPV